MRYGDPVAAVKIDLCRQKVHLAPPRGDVGREAVTVLFSCKFLSSEEKFARKKGHSTKERNHCQLVSFFYVMPLKITTPPRLFRSGERRGFFLPATISMVSLHGFSILILLTQSNHKSALLFSCSALFQVHTGIIHLIKRKVKHMFMMFLRKIVKTF